MIAFIFHGRVESTMQGGEAERKFLQDDLDEQGYDDCGHWVVVVDGMKYCIDCGKVGETFGHQDCEFPREH